MPSKKWWKRAQVYRRVAESSYNNWTTIIRGQGKEIGLTLDFSDESARLAYEYETHGTGQLADSGIFVTEKVLNGYWWGKHTFDLQIGMWRDGIKEGLTTVNELLNDPELIRIYTTEVLEKVLPTVEERRKWFDEEAAAYFLRKEQEKLNPPS